MRPIFKGMQFEPIWSFGTRIYTFSTEFGGLWVKIENISFYTRMYWKPTEKESMTR